MLLLLIDYVKHSESLFLIKLRHACSCQVFRAGFLNENVMFVPGVNTPSMQKIHLFQCFKMLLVEEIMEIIKMECGTINIPIKDWLMMEKLKCPQLQQTPLVNY